MHALAKLLYLLSLTVWIGTIIFFSFVVAPSIFGALPSSDAGRVIGTIFPTYYRLGYICGAVLLVTSVVLRASAAARGWWTVNSLLAALMLSVTVYAGAVIQPRASALRPQIHDSAAAPEAKREFDSLHRIAVGLNSVALLCGCVVSYITARTLQP